MKTKQQLQLAIDAIRLICIEHGIVLVGTCDREGILGEISIFDANDIPVPFDVDANLVDDSWQRMRVSAIGQPMDHGDKLFTYSNDAEAIAALLEAYAHDLQRGAQVFVHAATLIKAADLIRKNNK